MRILSWNVNGLRAVLKKGFLEWLEKESPDIICLQEIKAKPEQIPKSAQNVNGYHVIWQSAQRPGYSGTATYCKTEPLSVTDMNVVRFDEEGRVQALEFKDFTLINAYFPNSRPERARLDYKLDFCEQMTAFCNDLVKKGHHIVLCGDYNIAHNEIDLARPKGNEESPGFYIEERQAMTEFLKNGYIDTFRHFVKEPDHYTWWSYRARARERNVGWRIDYHCVDEKLLPKVKSVGILSDVLGSDHCPVELVLK